MFGDDRETESAADAVSRRRAAGESLKNAQTLADTDTGAVVVDDEEQVFIGAAEQYL